MPTVDPNWLNDRAKVIMHDAPEPAKHPAVSKRTWIILAVVLAVMVVGYFVLRTTEAF